VCAATGYWPPDIPFELDDLATVIQAINRDRQGGQQ